MRGHANLLDDLHALEDLERVRLLFDDLETKRGVIDLLGRAERAEGVRIFIGSENKLFSLSGSSTIIAPYRDGAGRIVGVLGVIGPTRLNYARVIPMVDYTAAWSAGCWAADPAKLVVFDGLSQREPVPARSAMALDFSGLKPDIPQTHHSNDFPEKATS